METKHSWMKRLRYNLDNQFSRGTGALIGWLAAVVALFILIAGIILTLTGLAPAQEAPYTFFEGLWMAVLRVLGSGTIGARGTEWGYRLLMLSVTIGGIFLYSTLIGLLTNGMRARLESLRKGRSEVLEDDHIVLLGWSEQIFTIIPELVEAKASEKSSCIAILANRDKPEMEDQIRQRVGHTGRTRIVCRTGNPMEMEDLPIVSINTARSIIIIAPESDNPDVDVIKVAMAVRHNPHRRKEPYHIISSIREPKNAQVAKMVGGDEVDWIVLGDVIPRIIAQTCRQSGLSAVYLEIANFSGNEIYLHQDETLVGRKFGYLLLSTQNTSLIGILTAGNRALLNPDPDTVLQPGDRLVVLAEDDSNIQFEELRLDAIQAEFLSSERLPAPGPENTLILGWNWRGPRVLRELDRYVAPGSEVLVVADPASLNNIPETGCEELLNQKACFQEGDITDRELLESLNLARFDHILLLCYSDWLPTHQADAQALISLLHLRDISNKGDLSYTIVSQLLDPRNRKLAAIAQADDFVVSNRLGSLLMAQVAETKDLNFVLSDLLSAEGSEIDLLPVTAFVKTGVPVNFYTVVEAARQRKAVALGYRKFESARDASRSYGVVLNPKKSQPIVFDDKDRIIVLTDHESKRHTHRGKVAVLSSVPTVISNS